jgi:gliding motility-associated-like protein
VRGQFFSRGSGSRVFPIGNNDGFFPAVLPDVKECLTSIGIEVMPDDPHLQLSDDYNILKNHYWKLISENSVFPDASIGLSTNETSNTFPSLSQAAILGAPIQIPAALNIGQRTSDNNFIYSDLPILKSDAMYTLAVSSDLKLKIHNLITPNNDQENNSLFIEQIDRYPLNTVTLADRWGSVIKRWENFSNSDSSFDFSSLSTGNYVCIVEVMLPNGRKKFSQMVSILK